ncbi:MAG: hypothetical protein JST21_03560 [Bacteroidetes bacterium]|nr:hypothetical protein [Bacteroidota bacterium]
MKPVSLNEIKQELQHLSATDITELCLRLARFKKENKELLSYLIFDAHNTASYIKETKQHIDELFKDVNRQNIYLAKKTLRKILREINKQARFTLNKQTEAELRIHFALTLKQTGIDIYKNKALENMFLQQIKKAKAALSGLHEDIQYDYQKMLDEIE